MQAAPSSRLEKLFQSSFPHAAAPHQEEEEHQQEEEQVVSLKSLLEPSSKTQCGEEEEQSPCRRSVRRGPVTNDDCVVRP